MSCVCDVIAVVESGRWAGLLLLMSQGIWVGVIYIWDYFNANFVDWVWGFSVSRISAFQVGTSSIFFIYLGDPNPILYYWGFFIFGRFKSYYILP